MKRTVLLCLCAGLVAGMPPSSPAQPRAADLAQLMQEKLDSAKALFEGIALPISRRSTVAPTG